MTVNNKPQQEVPSISTKGHVVAIGTHTIPSKQGKSAPRGQYAVKRIKAL
jgi:hypothetical protein